MAVLAAYAAAAAAAPEATHPDLSTYLSERVFRGASVSVVEPDPDDLAGFATYLDRYRAGLAAEQAAVKAF
jgi:sugar (pentulose or hexulose) kinase